MINPFVSDRYRTGEPSWLAFRKDVLESLEAAARSVDGGDGLSGAGRVIQVRARRAGMGKSHLLSRLTDALQDEFEVVRVSLHPGNLRHWEQNGCKGIHFGPGRRPQLLVLDHLDPFYGDPAAGMRIGRMVERLAEEQPRSVILFSVNRDVWRRLFASQLPRALVDLLTWEVRDLPPANGDEAEGLVIHRMERAGFEDHVILQFLERLEFEPSEVTPCKALSPRQVFRMARRQWESFAAEQSGAGRAMVAFSRPVSAVQAPFGAGDPKPFPAADQARQHLHAVAEALRQQSGPGPFPASSGQGNLRLLDASVPEQVFPSEPKLRLVPRDGRETEVALACALQEARMRFSSPPAQKYRPDLVFSLLHQVGERFPSINQRVLNPELTPEERILEWTLSGRCLWIGVAPWSRREVWEKTIRAWRAETAGREGRKLTGFAACEDGGEEIPRAEEVDLVELSSSLLCTLYAAEELLRGPHSGESAAGSRLTRFIANELDFFWSRLTRTAPVQTPEHAGPRSLRSA